MRPQDILHEIAVNDMIAASLSSIRDDGHQDHQVMDTPGYCDSNFEMLTNQLALIKQELPHPFERLRVEVALSHLEAAEKEIRSLYKRRIV